MWVMIVGSWKRLSSQILDPAESRCWGVGIVSSFIILYKVCEQKEHVRMLLYRVVVLLFNSLNLKLCSVRTVMCVCCAAS